MFTLSWVASKPEVLKRGYVTSDYLDATRGLYVQRKLFHDTPFAITGSPDSLRSSAPPCE